MDYGQAYMGIGATLKHAAAQLVYDGLVRAGIIWGAVMWVSLLVILALGRARRTQWKMWTGRNRPLVAAALICAMALGAGAAGGLVAQDQPTDEPAGEPLFEGTPLAGAHVTGRLGQLIGQYGQIAVKAYEDDVAFYEAAAAAVEEAFAVQAAEAVERANEREASEQVADGRETGEPTKAATATASGNAGSTAEGAAEGAAEGSGAGEAPTATASANLKPSAEGAAEGRAAGDQAKGTPTPPWEGSDGPYGDLKPALFFSDLHCNVGMTWVIGAAAKALKTDLVLDGGDTTMDGTAVERYCVDQLAGALPDGVTWVVAMGNHDSADTAKQARAAGATVLEGKVEKVGGLRILGDADPNHTEVGYGSSQVGDESIRQADKRLAKTACEDGPVDILLVHEPYMVEEALKSGCVPAALTGHMHHRADPRIRGEGVLYTQSSTGRDVNQTTTLGPLGSPAELTILLFDADGRIAAWQLLTIGPDASASLSAIQPWPALPANEPPEGGATTGSGVVKPTEPDSGESADQ
jgi:hypothetical protein